MKFEIKKPELGYGGAPDLIIPVVEFNKAQKDDVEMINLINVLEIFLSYYNIDWNVEADYEHISGYTNKLKSGNLIIAVKCDNPNRYRPNYWFELFLATNSEIKAINI